MKYLCMAYGDRTKMEALSKAMQEQLEAKKYDEAEQTLGQILAKSPAMGVFLNPMKLEIALKKGDYARVHALARGVLEGEETRDDSMALGRTVSIMIDDGDAAKLDKKLVMDLATKLYEVEEKTGWHSEWILAKAFDINQQWDQAISHQTKAVDTAPEQYKPMMQKVLEEIKAKKDAPK